MRKSKKPAFLLAGSVALLLCSFGSSALAVAIPQTTEQLVGNSSDVVKGRVASQTSRWTDSHSFIYTEVSIEVSEVVAGGLTKGSTISVFIPGGQVGDTGMRAEHAPEFTTGEEVLVYLTTNDGVFGVTSWEMGKFTVEKGIVREKNLPVAEYINEIKAFKK